MVSSFSDQKLCFPTKAYFLIAGSSVEEILQRIHSELSDEYGSHILPSSEWLFVNCGGWMGSMYLLHASLNEYLMFFGVGIDTSGNSGEYTDVSQLMQ